MTPAPDPQRPVFRLFFICHRFISHHSGASSATQKRRLRCANEEACKKALYSFDTALESRWKLMGSFFMNVTPKSPTPYKNLTFLIFNKELK